MKVSFETAKLAKEKGFKKKSRKSYKQPVVTKRGTDIKEARDYKLMNTDNAYTSITEISYPNEDFYAPTQAVLQKWLREVHDIYVEPLIDPFAGDFWYNLKAFKKNKEKAYKNDLSNNNYNTWEEALEAGLQEALKQI